jgi:hypothetical protein
MAAEIPLDSQITYVKTWLELCSLLGRDADRPKLEAILCSLESLKMVRNDATEWLVKEGHRKAALSGAAK